VPLLRRALTTGRETLRAELWPLPVLGVLAAVVAGIFLPLLDQHVDSGLPPRVTAYLFGGGAQESRTLLSTIATSLITVTSLTFSLTVVTLQLASSQFSPRLLRTFTRDRFVHVTLALFLSTFTFALMVLRTVRSQAESRSQFVPQVSVSLALVLALASVLGLVAFLAHLAREIRVETTLRTVHAEADDTLAGALVARDERSTEPLPQAPNHAVPLLAEGSGFLLEVDERDLLRVLVDADAMLRLDRAPGDSLVHRTPVGVLWTRSGDPVAGDLAGRVTVTLSVGFERTQAQDAEYGLRQLTDVAVKALSPGINDPTTAVHALAHSSALLCAQLGYDLGARVLADADGVVRAVLRRPDLDELLDLALTQPRRYGAGDPFVLARLAALLGEVAWHVHGLGDAATEHAAVARQVTLLRATVGDQDLDGHTRDQLVDRLDQVDATLRAVTRRRSVADRGSSG
jgi:uncharacterized membrane protein